MTINFISPYILQEKHSFLGRNKKGLRSGDLFVSPRLSSHDLAAIPFQSVHKRADGVEDIFALQPFDTQKQSSNLTLSHFEPVTTGNKTFY